MQTRLTAALVRRLLGADAPAKTTDYFDTGLGRFFLRCRPQGRPGKPFAAAFYVRYSADGVERRIKVADARTASLEQAQDAAKKLLARADLGHDPARERRVSRSAWTVREAVAAYFASSDFRGKSESTRRVDHNILHNHILHHLGGTKLGAIDAPAVRRLMRAVESDDRIGRHKRRLGGVGASRRVARLLSTLLSFAVAEGQLPRHPLRDSNLRLRGAGMRETVISTQEEYGRLFTTLDQLAVAGRIRELARAFIILAAATGCRKSELQRLQWRDVDLAAGCLSLRHTKGARLAGENSRTESAGLPPVAAEAVARIKPEDAEPTALVFPTRGRAISIDREWRLARREAGLPPDLVLHSLRHSVGSLAAASGMNAFQVQRLLRHRNVSTTQRYVHWAERHQLQLLERAMSGVLPAPQASAAEPVPLPRRGRP
jgi:integrase